jgi:hypothetical protein
MSCQKVRSIPHRRGCGPERGRSQGRLAMDSMRLAFRLARSANLPAYPPSANVVSTKAHRPREVRSSGFVPWRSWPLAAWT